MGELEQYKERLHIALTAAKICVFEVDLLKQLYTYFENAEAIFGVSGDVILKDVRPFRALDPESYRLAASDYFSHPEDSDIIKDAFTQILNGFPATYEARMKAGGSEYIWCRIHAVPIMEGGKPVRMIGVITDISDVREKTEILEKAVRLDDFTGIYKKGYTIALIKRALQHDWDLRHALIILDIDNFKNFNDTYGHDEGDKILKELSRRLRGAFRKTDIVGRFGGDEFLIFARNISDTQWPCSKLQNLLRFELDGLTCTNSAGVAFYPQDAESFDDLFKKADMALYQAKASKENVVFYHEI